MFISIIYIQSVIVFHLLLTVHVYNHAFLSFFSLSTRYVTTTTTVMESLAGVRMVMVARGSTSARRTSAVNAAARGITILLLHSQ